MRAGGCLPDSVAIMANRKNRGIVLITCLFKHVQRPCGAVCDRECGRPVAQHSLAGDVLKHLRCGVKISEKLFRALLADHPVLVAMRCDFVPLFGNLSDELFVPGCDPSQHKKCRPRAGCAEHLQYSLDAWRQPGLVSRPLSWVNPRCLDVEIFL